MSAQSPKLILKMEKAIQSKFAKKIQEEDMKDKSAHYSMISKIG